MGNTQAEGFGVVRAVDAAREPGYFLLRVRPYRDPSGYSVTLMVSSEQEKQIRERARSLVGKMVMWHGRWIRRA
jgi:hypothetical protein